MSRPTNFQPINDDVDEQIEALARAKGIPALVSPANTAGPAATQAHPATSAGPVPSLAAGQAASQQPGAPSPPVTASPTPVPSSDVVEPLPSPANEANIEDGGEEADGAKIRRPKVPKGAAGKATPRNRLKTINIELPDYIWTELKIRAAKQQTTVKHVILKCIRANGITVNDADMIPDGRRLRGKNYEQG